MALMVRLGLASLAFALAAVPWSPLLADPAAGGAVAAAPVGDPANGGKLFASVGCGGCHTLAAAGANGSVGPSLDGDPNLTVAFITDRVTNGQGQMPAFGGQLSDQEIADVAAYVAKVAAK